MAGRQGWSGRVVTKARRDVRSKGQVQPCSRCGRPIDLDAEEWHVDHLIELALGGSLTDPSNQGPSHARCNTAAGGRLGGRIAAARRREPIDRAKRTRPW